MRKLALILLLAPSLAFAQVQVQGKPGGAIQIGGNQPGVSSIQDLTGPFSFTGAGFTGCTFDSGTGITTCTFTGGTGGITSLTTNFDAGLSALSGSTLNIPKNHGGNTFEYVNFMSLVGAFTDSSGNVIQPIAIGKGPVIFAVPHGATQLQMGVNDDIMGDNTGSWVVSVDGTNYTVSGGSPPWLHAAGANSTFPTNPDSGSPAVATIGVEGSYVTIQYVSGTVSGPGGLCSFVSTSNLDPSGANGCALSVGSLGSFLPGFWAQPAIGASAFTLTTTGTSGPATYIGGVLNIPQYSGGGGTPGGSTGQIQYNNAGVFGGDTGSTTDGAGNVTTKTLSTTGTAGVAGRVSIQQGTAPANIANNVSLIGSSSITAYRIQLPAVQPTSGNTFLSCTAADPAVCTWAAGGGVATTGTPASGNLTKFSGASSITNGDLSGDVTTSGTLATTLSNTAVTPGSYTSANITVDSKGRVTAAANGSGGGGSPSSPAHSLQAANAGVTGFESDSTITLDTTNHRVNVGTLGANYVSIGPLSTATAWNFDTASPATAALSLGSGTHAAGKYIDGASGAWTSLPGNAYPTPVTVNITSAQSEIDLTGCITSTYRDYTITYDNVTIAAGSGTIQPGFQFGLSGTWDTTSGHYNYGRAFYGLSSGTATGSDGAHSGTGIVPSGTSGDTSWVVGNYFSGRMTLHTPLTASPYGNFGEWTGTDQYTSSHNLYGVAASFYYSNSSGSNTLTYDSLRVIALSGTSVTFTGTITCQPLPQ